MRMIRAARRDPLLAKRFQRRIGFLNAAIFMGLYTVLGLRQFEDPWTPVVSQAVGNALLGVVGAQLVELLPGLRDRRKQRRVVRH